MHELGFPLRPGCTICMICLITYFLLFPHYLLRKGSVRSGSCNNVLQWQEAFNSTCGPPCLPILYSGIQSLERPYCLKWSFPLVLWDYLLFPLSCWRTWKVKWLLAWWSRPVFWRKNLKVQLARDTRVHTESFKEIFKWRAVIIISNVMLGNLWLAEALLDSTDSSALLPRCINLQQWDRWSYVSMSANLGNYHPAAGLQELQAAGLY